MKGRRIQIAIVYLGLAIASESEPNRLLAVYDEKGQSYADLEEQERLREELASEKASLELSMRDKFQMLAKFDRDADYCLAYNAQQGECLVTEGRFQERLVSHFPDEFGNVDPDSQAALIENVRKEVFNSFFHEAFLAYQLDVSGKADEILSSVRRERERVNSALAKSIPEKTLRDLFKSQFTILSRLRQVGPVELFASTDSILLDSLYRTYEKSGKGSFSKWIPTFWEIDSLPEDIATHVVSLQNIGWNKPFRCSFGFIMAKKSQTGLGRLTFNEALPILITLALNPPIADTANPSAIYRDVKAWKMDPDTLVVEIRLVPRKLPRHRVAADSQLPLNAVSLSRFRPMVVTQFALPENLRCQLDFAGQDYGEFQDHFGTWTFRLLERRPGCRTLHTVSWSQKIEKERKAKERLTRVKEARRTTTEKWNELINAETLKVTAQILKPDSLISADLGDNAWIPPVQDGMIQASGHEKRKMAAEDLARTVMSLKKLQSLESKWVNDNIRREYRF